MWRVELRHAVERLDPASDDRENDLLRAMRGMSSEARASLAEDMLRPQAVDSPLALRRLARALTAALHDLLRAACRRGE